jgi:hypothetical protein
MTPIHPAITSTSHILYPPKLKAPWRTHRAGCVTFTPQVRLPFRTKIRRPAVAVPHLNPAKNRLNHMIFFLLFRLHPAILSVGTSSAIP